MAVSEYRLLFGRLEEKGNEFQAAGGRGQEREQSFTSYFLE